MFLRVDKYDCLIVFVLEGVIMDIFEVMCVFVVVVECNGFSVVV